MTELHGLTLRGLRNKYLKDLFLQWRGVLAAYDEGLASGDAVLGAALWRNLWKGSPTDANGQEIDWVKVATVVAYMRRVLVDLARMDEMDLVTAVGRSPNGGRSLFGANQKDKQLAESRSTGINQLANE